MIRRGMVALLMMGCFAEVVAADDVCIRRTRHWGGDGPADQLVVVNDYAFFGGRTLRVADLSDPTLPTVVHEVRLEAPAADIDTHGDRIYLVDGSDELIVIDAADPRRATIEDRFWPEEEGWKLFRLAFNGDLGVISGQTFSSGIVTKLLFADLSGSGPRPAVLGSVVIAGQVASVAIGTRAALAVTDDDRLFIIDVSDPSEPVVALETGVSYLAGPAGITDLRAAGDLMALADTAGNVGVVDISDPDRIVFRGSVQGLGIGFGSLAFDGSTIHVAGSTCTNLGVCGGYAVIDVPAIGAPTLAGRTDGPKLASPVSYRGFALAAAFKAGMRIIDTSSAAEPQLLDAVLPARAAGAIAGARFAVGVIDTTTLAPPEEPGRNTLRVLDRSTGGQLEEVSSYAPEGEMWAVTAADDFIAVAMYDEVSDFHSVEVIDVTDLRMPRRGSRIGAEISIEYDTSKPHLDSASNMMYFSLRNSDDILIHRVTAGAARQVGRYRPEAEMLDFAAASTDLLAVAVRSGDTDRIELVDTRDPSSPLIASTFDLPAPADEVLSLDGDGSQLGILVRDSDGPGGPAVYSIAVDAADPANPSLIADGLPGSAWVALGGGILHTQGDPEPWSPHIQRHIAIDLDDPSHWMDVENIGPLDVKANRVDANRRSFNVSRDGRVEEYSYGICLPAPAGEPDRSAAEE